MEQGMASFVKQTIGMYRSGFDSRRMLLQVSTASAFQQPVLSAFRDAELHKVY